MAAVESPVFSQAAPAPSSPDRRRGFLSQTQATEPVDAVVRGRLPDWLRGSLLLNGPAIWDLPGASYAHWFDGLALLHRLRFSAAGVRYHSRFLDSEEIGRASCRERV